MRRVTHQAKAEQVKLPVLALGLITLMLAAGTAFAATGTSKCGSEKCASASSPSSFPGATLPASTKAPIDSVASLSASAPMTAESDNIIVRDESDTQDPLPESLTLGDLKTSEQKADEDAVARLLERRLLEKSNDESPVDNVDLNSALPGIGSTTLRLYRERMYRTDI